MRDQDPPDSNPRIAPGDLEALHADAFGWALSLSRGRRDEAEDVLQTTYLLIIEGRACFDGRSSLKTWLFGVIRNVARGRWRRGLFRLRFERPVPELPLDVAGEDGQAASAASDGDRVWATLAALPARQREVLELVFHRDLTIEQAARVMNVSLGTARAHYERGKARLRRELGA